MAKPKTAKKAAPARRQAPTKMPDGDAGVHRGVAGLEKAVAKRVDALIEREVPDVRRAIKWNMPFYGIEGQTRAGWVLWFGPNRRPSSIPRHAKPRLRGACFEGCLPGVLK